MLIYLITNLVNNKRYIGQTRRSIKERWANHCNKKSKNVSAIKAAINSHGIDNFKMEVIDTAFSIEELNKKEIEWISKLNTICPNGYNLDSGGKQKATHPETKKKMSIAKLGVSHAQTTETRIKISQSKIGKSLSQDHKLNLSLARKDKKKVKCLNNGVIYDSYSEAARNLSVSVAHITKCVNGIRKTVKGFMFEGVNGQ